MRKLLIAVEEKLHTLDPRLVGFVHESPAHSGKGAGDGILLCGDICNWLSVDV